MGAIITKLSRTPTEDADLDPEGPDRFRSLGSSYANMEEKMRPEVRARMSNTTIGSHSTASTPTVGSDDDDYDTDSDDNFSDLHDYVLFGKPLRKKTKKNRDPSPMRARAAGPAVATVTAFAVLSTSKAKRNRPDRSLKAAYLGKVQDGTLWF